MASVASNTNAKVLVTGATGFVGQALVRSLTAKGHRVVATSRRPRPSADDRVEWRVCDLNVPSTLPPAFAGVDAAYYLVHSMGGGNVDYRAEERRAAEWFAAAAARTGVKRIIYLGGPAPHGKPSEHLRSRLEVGEVLRAGSVVTIELRASMVIGYGSASWQIVRDLALRLPAMVLPRWLRSRTRPVALDDVTAALVGALDLEVERSVWFDIPGPEIITGSEILRRVALLQGRRMTAVEVPFLSPKLSAHWLRLVTRADYSLARELVLGLKQDLVPEDDRYWALIGHRDLLPFDEAVKRAIAAEPRGINLWEELIGRGARKPA